MDVALSLVLPGLLGGLLLAVLLARLNRTPSSGPARRTTLAPVSPDLINMAHIRIAGVGGLGMMAAGVVIAIYLPEIGLSLLAGVVVGGLIAIALIVRRDHAAASGPGGGGLPPAVLNLRNGGAPAPQRPAHEPRLPRHPAAVTA